ncbi:polysaccharide deacetylase family protein [Engelhardtia mirabilis]|uniref:WalW protein n=1 Tax=Engelhardtia mirabilis TaxID=2528011 RepID=A0A518BLG6_9BACT|nr:hypothetical protein Pla133_29090 [Planctomycetes bacterium Pla133]QDV02146.1 hypothetical protein Pla86_29080 [Planctomycetes bacterium Pla86]
MPPTLLVQVHTEEEFDWQAPFDRKATATTSVPQLPRLQAVFDAHGTAATWAVDWPVVEHPGMAEGLATWVRDGRAEVGAHLHPWVNPPFVEEVNRTNSFAGNLPPELEREKLGRLVAQIEARIGVAPRTYVAGRYGVGPNTLRALVELGFRIDGSATPPFDFRAEGGPDFSRFPVSPYRYDGVPELLGLPVTGGYLGLLRSLGRVLMPLIDAPLAKRLGVEAILSRLAVLERVRLSPEGFSLAEMQALTRRFHADGERVFTLSLHSTSILPGGSPYCATESDVVELLGRLDRYLGWFRGEFQGRIQSHLSFADTLAEIEGGARPWASGRADSTGAGQAQFEARADVGRKSAQIPPELPGQTPRERQA